MTYAQIRNLLAYALTLVAPPIADAVYQYLQSTLATGKPIDWGQVGVVTLMAAAGAVVAASRPKAGREDISELVSTVGVDRSRAILSDHATYPADSGHTNA